MPMPRSLLDLMYQRDQDDPRNAPPAPQDYGDYYRGNMPVYRRPNQDRNTMSPDELQQYWWAQRRGIPQERP